MIRVSIWAPGSYLNFYAGFYGPFGFVHQSNNHPLRHLFRCQYRYYLLALADIAFHYCTTNEPFTVTLNCVVLPL